MVWGWLLRRAGATPPSCDYPTYDSAKPRNSTTDFPRRSHSPSFGKRFVLRQESGCFPKAPDAPRALSGRSETPSSPQVEMTAPHVRKVRNMVLEPTFWHAEEASICRKRTISSFQQEGGWLCACSPREPSDARIDSGGHALNSSHSIPVVQRLATESREKLPQGDCPPNSVSS